MRKHFSKAGAVIATVIGVPCFLLLAALSVAGFIDAAQGPEELEIVRGDLHILTQAKDPVSGTESLIIERKTQMLQYREKSVDDGETYDTVVETVWEESHIDSFRNGFRKYENPPFPEELKSAVCFGTAEIGENGVRMAEPLLQCFRYADESYVGHAMIAAPDLPDDLLEQYGLVQTSPGRFVSKGLTEKDPGCVIVTYTVLDPALDGTPVTAAGAFTESGELGDQESDKLLYTRNVPTEELTADFKHKAAKDGILCLAAALIAAAVVAAAWLF